MKKDAIERRLEIIGEATNRILKEIPDINISEAQSGVFKLVQLMLNYLYLKTPLVINV